MTQRKDDGEYFKAGERVVVNGRGPNDHSQRGRYGTFIAYVPTGYGYMARVFLDPKSGWWDKSEDRWILHPESLDKAEVTK